jgi:hypothetical protein
MPGCMAQTAHNATPPVIGMHPSPILGAAMEIVPTMNTQPALIAIRSTIPLPHAPNAMTGLPGVAISLQYHSGRLRGAGLTSEPLQVDDISLLAR